MGVSGKTILLGYTRNRMPFFARVSEKRTSNPFYFLKEEVLVAGEQIKLGLDLDTSCVRFAYRNEPVPIEYDGRKSELSHRILEGGTAYYLTAEAQPGKLEINGTTCKEITDELLYTFSGEKPITVDILFYGHEDWERNIVERNDNYVVEETTRRDSVHEMQGQPHL